MSFNKMRRQKFLSEDHAQDFKIDLLARIDSASVEAKDPTLPARPRRSFSWQVASNFLELFVLKYTAGDTLQSLRDMVPEMVLKFTEYVPLDKPKPNEAHTLDITQQDAYVYMLWILSICQLVGHGELTATALSWLDVDTEINRGKDGLFESIAERLTGSEIPTKRVLLYDEVYRPLAKATVADPRDRPALVGEFLKNWYKSMKPCYWHGTHSDKDGSSYFGYWSFEAALVTYLWDIDDTSYRDHLVYPKDMVDFARANFPYKGPWRPARLRCEAGQPCPREGWWFTPANDNSRQHFRVNETMPEYKSDYGRTIWQWDPDQGR